MPSTSSTASCSPGTRSDSCRVPKPGPALQLGLSQLRGVKAQSSPSGVFTVGRDMFPVLAMPYPMLQRTCTLIALPSTTGAWGFSVEARWICQCLSTVPAPIIPWQCHQFPKSRFSPCHPYLPRAAVEKGGDGSCSWRPPSSARYTCWCIHHPRLVWDMCHLLPHCPASPDAITVLWTVLTQEGCLDVWPLPFSKAFPPPLPPKTQCPGTQVCPCIPHSALTLPSPQLPSGTQDGGWFIVARVRQGYKVPSALPGLSCAS